MSDNPPCPLLLSNGHPPHLTLELMHNGISTFGVSLKTGWLEVWDYNQDFKLIIKTL
jgi:hypothetical protein